MIDSGHLAETLAARSLVTIGSMLATYIVYLAMRPLAGRSLAINMAAVALLAIPASVTYSSMNWMAFAQVDKQIERENAAEKQSNRIVIDARAVEAARKQALAAIATARATIKQANEQAAEAVRATQAAQRARQEVRRIIAAPTPQSARAPSDHEAGEEARQAAREAAQEKRQAALEAAQEKRQAAREAAQAQREGWEEYRRGMQEARDAVAEARRHGVNIDLDEIMSGVEVPTPPMPARAPATPAAPAAPAVKATPRPLPVPIAAVAPEKVMPTPPAVPAPIIQQISPGSVMIQVGAPANYMHEDKSVAAQIADQALNGYFFFAAWGALFLALSYAAAVRAAEREAAGYRTAARDAELRALRYQVNPHFLFNTLNSLSTLVLKDQREQAESMILNLSTFFRTSLTADPTEDVLLSEEIRLQRLYLDIEAVRFPERLIVSISVPATLANACVPCLILQPLVENAIKYGVSRAKRPVTVLIEAREDSHGLVLTVEDDGDPFPQGEKPTGTGVGLKNVTDRLKARFGSDAACRYGPLAHGGFGVTLFMPLVRNGC